MIKLGLTGSIGMGKSTTAAMFAARGVPVFDSDAVVHELYAGQAVPMLEAAFPGITSADGVIDRTVLAQKVLGNREALQKLEAIVHPLVRREREAFLSEQKAAGHPLVLLDVPLLFESGGDADVDRIAVVSCPEDVQKARVMARPGMTEEKFASILARQVPDAEKRARANFIIETGEGLAATEQRVEAIILELTGQPA